MGTYVPPNTNGQATMANSAPVVIASNQSAVPISAASLPLPTGATQDTTLTGGTQQTKITDGTNVATVKAASTAAGATDKAVVVAISPNNTVPVSLATNTPTLQSGSTTAVTQATGTNLHAVIDTGSTTAVTQATAANLNATVVNAAGTALMGKVGIDQTTVGTTNAVSIAQLGTTTVATGNGVSTAGVQRVALVSDQTTNTNPLYTKQQAQTAGGATPFQLISAATTNATSVKASAGTVYGVQAFNNSATVAFLKLYNKASAPTVGTDTPVKTIMIPANGGAVLPITDIGVAFGTGIALAVTGLATVADTTAVALSQCQIGIDYA